MDTGSTHGTASGPGPDRRELLGLSAVAGAGLALTLNGVSFAEEATGEGPAQGPGTRTLRGHLPAGAPDFVYLPVEVPHGVREIAVSYDYDTPQVPDGTQGNALDIGVFDERGTPQGSGNAPDLRGFRGWSGGARKQFTISAERATPGYLPGPIQAGTWHVALGPYTVAPQGMDYTVTVTVRYGPPGRTPQPVYPPQRAGGRGRAWYRGDCHLHTVYSDGERTPAETAAAARAAGLDFVVTTEHNTTAGHGAWQGLWGDDLLIVTGTEITTRNGHCLALGTEPGALFDWRYRARDESAYPHWVRRVHQAGGLVVPAHPNCPFVGCQWKFGYRGADAVEVWNGPWTVDDEQAVGTWDNMLRSGNDWLPAMGNSDAHKEGQDVGLPHTVVLAEDLSRRALLDGISTGRSYLAESDDITLQLTASGPRGEHAGIGERLAVSDVKGDVTVELTVSGAPAGARYRLLTDEGELLSGKAGAAPVRWTTTPAVTSYVRAEIRHPADPHGPPELPGAMAAMTNPVWLDGAR